jgi:hypothetical protein
MSTKPFEAKVHNLIPRKGKFHFSVMVIHFQETWYHVMCMTGLHQGAFAYSQRQSKTLVLCYDGYRLFSYFMYKSNEFYIATSLVYHEFGRDRGRYIPSTAIHIESAVFFLTPHT